MVFLLLPAKDEAENLGPLLERARALGFKAVVCDDGSSDGTAQVAAEAGALVLRHEENRGLAEALRTLFSWAADHLEDSDVVVTMDADGTMDPAEALPALGALERGEADLVVFSRYRAGYQAPLSRALLSLGARLVLASRFRIPGITDYTTGFRAYRVGFLRAYRERHPRWFDASGFTAQTELLVKAHRMGARIAEAPGRVDYGRKRGRSKMRLLKTALEYLSLALKG